MTWDPLALHQLGEDAAPGDQRVVRARLGDLSAVQHEDAVTVPHRAQAVFCPHKAVTQ